MPIIKNIKNLSTLIEDNESLSKMTKKKKQSVKLNLQRKFELMGLTKIAVRCGECSSFLTFDHQIHITSHDERQKLMQANFCKNKFCPTCSKVNSLKVAMIVKQILEILGQKYQPIFVTLTIKNPSITRLRGAIELLNKSFARMTKTKRWMNSIVGFFRAIEYLGDNTPEGECHPHIHSILLVENNYFDRKSNKYITKDEWITMWRKALQVEYDPSIYIESIYDKMKEYSEISENLACALEVAKYCTTFADLQRLSDQDFGFLYRATKGARLYAFGGIFKDTKMQAVTDISHELSVDKQEWKTLETLFYKWVGNHYQLTETNPLTTEENNNGLA